MLVRSGRSPLGDLGVDGTMVLKLARGLGSWRSIRTHIDLGPAVVRVAHSFVAM
jgi:hypothetical protein